MGDRAGFSEETSRAILAVHDQRHGTSLLDESDAGRPRLCQSCHEDPVLSAPGREGLLNLPAALHGLHANYLPGMAERACACCHPAAANGATRCLRGRHGPDGAGLTCVECHGAIEDHALALLKQEAERGKPATERLNCHVDFSLQEMNGFNQWTSAAEALYRNRTDARGLHCPACHGAPHAIYPATNPQGVTRDDLPPLMAQGDPGTVGTGNRCAVCHRQAMPGEGHHPNMARP
jgi:hypothetical protein